MLIFFFFSSRRRHTRCGRDWSSDVCSSDLATPWSAALGVRQTRTTLELVRRVADQGVAAVMISHSLEDVFAVADRIVALRSEERRVGKECRYRSAREHEKENREKKT